MMAELITEMENMLRVWKIEFLLAEVEHHLAKHNGQTPYYPLIGPMVHHRTLERAILRCWSPHFDWQEFHDRYICEKLVSQQVEMNDLTNVPLSLLCWAQSPRRVFDLRSDVCNFLNRVSVDRVRWKDIIWPFDRFILRLEQPIKGRHLTSELVPRKIGSRVLDLEVREMTYDTILVYFYDVIGCNSQKVLEFRLLPTLLADLDLHSKQEVTEIERALKAVKKKSSKNNEKRWQKLKNLLLQACNRLDVTFPLPTFTVAWTEEVKNSTVATPFLSLANKGRQEMVEEGINIISNQRFGKMPEEADTALRYIVGLCLLLGTRIGRAEERDWQPYQRQVQSGDNGNSQGQSRPPGWNYRGTISEPDLIHYVLAKQKLHDVIQTLNRPARQTAGKTQVPRWVPAHQRRPAGFGHIPGYPKTVEVESYIANAHLLLEGELYGGGITVIDQVPAVNL